MFPADSTGKTDTHGRYWAKLYLGNPRLYQKLWCCSPPETLWEANNWCQCVSYFGTNLWIELKKNPADGTDSMDISGSTVSSSVQQATSHALTKPSGRLPFTLWMAKSTCLKQKYHCCRKLSQ